MNHCTVYLSDGKSILDLWPRNFDHMPTIGDFVTIDCEGERFLKGFRKLAMVTRIERDAGSRTRIYLEAEPMNPPARRMVILLNENYVPAASRHEVERHLRKTLDLPIFEWTRSEATRPVLEIHSTLPVPGDRIRSLCSEVRQIMEDAPLPV
jgi:hypothetical protein